MKTNKQISKKREEALGKQINGKAHLNSGALWFQKGDVSNDQIIIEDKFTKEAYFSLTSTIINKIEKEGKHEQKIPIITIGYNTYDFNLGIVNINHCKDDIHRLCMGSIVTHNKSALLKYLYFYEEYLFCNNIYVCRLTYSLLNKSFYIFELNSLIENLNSLLYL